MEPIYPNHDNCTDTEDLFEQRFSTRSLRILKILTPFLPQNIQPGLAILIRMQELSHSLNCLHTLTPASFVLASEKNNTVQHTLAELLQPDTLNHIFKRLSPLLLPQERNELAKIRQLMQMFETYKQLEPLMSMFAEMTANTAHTNDSTNNPDTDAENSATAPDFSTGFSPEMLMSMLSPDMLQNAESLMQLFTSGSSHSTTDSLHSDDTDTHVKP